MSPMLFLSVFLFGCENKTDTPSEDSPAEQETDSAEDGEVVEEVSLCETLGLTAIPFSEGPFGNSYGSKADDFTVNTLNGEWNLMDNWSGCESYLFVNHHTDYDYPNQIWSSSARDLLQASPPNVHYFFMSYNQGDETAAVTEMQDKFENALSTLSEDEQEHWRARLHYVTDSAWEAGSIGDFLQSRGAWSVAIDRQQQFQEVGYLALPPNFEGALESLAYEAEHFNYLMNLYEQIESLDSTTVVAFDKEPVHNATTEADFPDAQTIAQFDTMHIELQLECGDPYYENCGEWDKLAYLRLCSQPTLENPYENQSCQPYVPEVMGLCQVDDEETTTECRTNEDCSSLVEDSTEDSDIEDTQTATCAGYAPAIDAETMTCECDKPTGETSQANQTCNEDGTGFGECSCPCDTEIGRWITSYARGGHWILDASPMMSFFVEGGTESMRYSGPYTYQNTLTFHFSNQGKNGTPQQMHSLFQGGGFNQEYNDKYEPLEIEIPSDATRVELYAVISGHGWGAEVENCAEFCNHTHHFTINGTEYIFDHPEAGMATGCIDQINLGTTPNQFGTWPYGRGGWCPGKQVDPWIVDVTDVITPGSTATVTYQGLFEGADYVPQPSNSGQGFGANIKMESYLVISK